MTKTIIDIASTLDHTLLKADCFAIDIKTLCEEAIEYGFVAVCIPPFFIQLAKRVLANSNVKIVTVVGFPTGFSATPAKVEEIKRAVDEGADELDVVVNIAAVKNKRWNYVSSDLDSCVRASQMRGRKIKVILETALLTLEEIKKLCEICVDLEVDFVKTSTGTQGGATIEVVKLLRDLLPDSIKIKASGGIRTREVALDMLKAGADRIGSSSGIKIMREDTLF